MKYFVIFFILIGLSGTAFAQGDDKPIHATSDEENYQIEIIGLKEEYAVGEEYSFYFVISGYGYPCANYEVSYPDEYGNLMYMGAEPLCDANPTKQNFEINSFERMGTSGNNPITKPGNYKVTVTFDKPNKYYPTTLTKEFRVVDNPAQFQCNIENESDLKKSIHTNPAVKQFLNFHPSSKVEVYAFSDDLGNPLTQVQYFREGLGLSITINHDDGNCFVQRYEVSYDVPTIGIGVSLTHSDYFEADKIHQVIAAVKDLTNPHKQMKKGIPLYQIKCKEGLTSIVKIDRIKPACVTDATWNVLLERGWTPLRLGMPAETNILITYNATMVYPQKVTKEYNPDSPYFNMVFFVNNDIVPHTINASDNSWSTGIIEPGKTGSMSFNDTSSYRYYVVERPQTSGTIVFDSQSLLISLEKDSQVLSEINQQAIIYQKNNEPEKFSAQKKLMQEKLEEISSQTLGLNIFIDDLYDSLFPFVDGSEIKIDEDKEQIEICNIVEKFPMHFERIKNATMFEMFAEKYSEYPIELSLQDERRGQSLFHYGLIAKSDDGRSALTFFHVNSCTDEIIDSDDYFLSCHNDQKREVFGTKNRDDILASLNHEDFCIIPLDEWRQSIYEYGRMLSEKEEKYIQQLENAKYDDEAMRALQVEMHQIDKLHNLVLIIVSGNVDDKTIQEKIQEYKKAYGDLPDDFLKLIENKK